MITSVKEVHSTPGCGHGPHGLTYYTYFICRCATGGRAQKYHMFRLNNVLEEFKVLGNELSLEHCRRIIAEHEPCGTDVKKHYAGGKRR